MSDAMEPVRARIRELKNEVSKLEAAKAELTKLEHALAAYEGKLRPASRTRTRVECHPQCDGCDVCRRGPDYR